jgi:hypothetical protein
MSRHRFERAALCSVVNQGRSAYFSPANRVACSTKAQAWREACCGAAGQGRFARKCNTFLGRLAIHTPKVAIPAGLHDLSILPRVCDADLEGRGYADAPVQHWPSTRVVSSSRRLQAGGIDNGMGTWSRIDDPASTTVSRVRAVSHGSRPEETFSPRSKKKPWTKRRKAPRAVAR